MQEKGLMQKEVISLINSYTNQDLSYFSGRLLGSMIGVPHAFASRVYSMNLEKDIGLPSIFSSTPRIEQETIQMICSIFSNPQAVGHIVSGGTEANVIALWAMRNLKHKEKPEVIIPESCHFSFEKAANLLNLKLVKVPLDKNFKVNTASVEKLINENTIAIVGTAGTTELGVIDPIEKLAQIALDHKLYLHVDAAFGGFIIPFLRNAGYDLPAFDFSIDGVCSITADPHKMLLVPTPAGGIFFKDKSFFNAVTHNASYLLGFGVANETILGTRPAAPVISTFAILKLLGLEGLRKNALYSMELTNFLYERVKKLKSIKPVIKPEMNILAFNSTKLSPTDMSDWFRKKGWILFAFQNSVRVVLLPYLMRIHAEEFANELEQLDKALD